MWLLKFLQEPDGKPSMTRLISFFSVGSILIAFLGLNISSLIKNGGFIDFGANAVAIVLIAMGAKVAHSVFKDKSSAPVGKGAEEGKSTDGETK